MKKASQDVTWRGLCALRWLMTRLPHRMALALGAALGTVLWFFSKRKVDDAEVRCVSVLGVGATTARSIVRNSYRNIGRGAAEMLRTAYLSKNLSQCLCVHGAEHLEKAFARQRGVILLSAHLDNWEIAAIWGCRHYLVHAIGADQRDERITDLLQELRSEAGVINVEKGQGLRGAIKCLKQGHVLAVLMDQDAKEKGLVIPFLGVPASTPLGVVKLATRFSSPVVPVKVVRRGSSSIHDVTFYPPLEQPDGVPFGTDEALSLKLCNDIISQWVLENPEQWLLWIYPRWGRPEPEAWRYALRH